MSHADLRDLIAYERGELDTAHADRIEDHYFACARCTDALEAVQRLGDGIVGLVDAGLASGSVRSSFIDRMRAAGFTLRSYRLAPGEEVACTASPEDHFVIVRLHLGAIDGGDSIDVTATVHELATGAVQTLQRSDVVIDRDTGELVFLQPATEIRALPRTRWTMQATVRGPGGERKLGPFTLDHTPWEELP